MTPVVVVVSVDNPDLKSISACASLLRVFVVSVVVVTGSAILLLFCTKGTDCTSGVCGALG